MPGMTTLVWFRQDLRLTDNPALAAALESGAAVVPVYIHAPTEEGAWAPGAASRWWLHHSLERLGEDLARRGSRLTLRAEPQTLAALLALARECGAVRIVWNRRYEPSAIARDQDLKTALRAAGIHADSYNGALLHEPWTVQTRTGGPFQVFTPFWRHCLSLPDPPEPGPAPRALPAPPRWPASERLDRFDLLPRIDWAGGLRDAWTPGSAAAQRLLARFLEEGFEAYGEQRDHPGTQGTSRLSPHLHYGEIGPREIWHATRRSAQRGGRHSSWRESKFLAELGWREFAHHLLYHFPQTAERPLREKFANFPWKNDPELIRRWTRGATGYPIVDAAMRELWRTGWMHNRARMIAGSFLVKDLLADLDPGGTLVLGHLGRRRPCRQYPRMAVGGGLRRRCGALFPGLQSGFAGGQIRSGGRLRAALGAGNRAAAERMAPSAMGGAGAGSGGGRTLIRGTLPSPRGRS